MTDTKNLAPHNIWCFLLAALKTNEVVHHFSEELLCVLPVINLVISPSRSVKAVASHVLSRFSLLVLELPASCSSEQQDISMVHHISRPTFILPKLVHHLWSQVIFYPIFFFCYAATLLVFPFLCKAPSREIEMITYLFVPCAPSYLYWQESPEDGNSTLHVFNNWTADVAC